MLGEWSGVWREGRGVAGAGCEVVCVAVRWRRGGGGVLGSVRDGRGRVECWSCREGRRRVECWSDREDRREGGVLE